MRIDLVGRFRVAAARPADESAWRLRKARSLVKLLALTPGHRIHRERVLEALWPDRELAAAANNLRQAVFVARRAFDTCGVPGAERLALRDEMLALEGPLWIDVEAFAAAGAQAEASGDAAAHERALALCAGELLPEDRFEPWAAAPREALRERRLVLAVALAGRHETAGDLAAALAALQRALGEDPLHEPAVRTQMRLLAQTGRRHQALAAYQLLRDGLEREYADEPSAETRRLYQRILTRADEHAGDATRRAAPADPTPPGHLPGALTSFVGRERQLQELGGLLARTRLLTLTGPGGCGKTRLALELARAARAGYADGAWLVELGALSDGALVAGAAARVIGAESRSDRPADEALIAHLRDRRALLLLDTCEHLIDACAQLAERLLAACPQLVLLATSREPLRAGGEVVWRVPSLSLPAPGEPPQDAEAVRLFVERAAAASAGFALSAANADAVAEICRRLDGIPLALELGAARAGVLTPSQIAQRLRDSLAVLGAGTRTGLTRQQTLTATIDWSHALLDAGERTLFRRLGAFAGGASLEAVERVCEGDLDVLARLVDKSLVVVEQDAAAARYRLLDTVATYARERLERAGETAALATRHRRYYAALAEAGDAREGDADDLRAAFVGARQAEPETALGMAAALWPFWSRRGDRLEGARALEAALAAAPAPSAARGHGLLGLSVLSLRGEPARSERAARESVAAFEASGDDRGRAEAFLQLACVNWLGPRPRDALVHAVQSLTLAARIDAPELVAAASHTIGVIDGWRRAPDSGERLDAAIALLRALPADAGPLPLPTAVGALREPQSEGLPPRLILEETFVAARRVSAGQAVAHALADRALVARDAGDSAAGRAALEESLARFQALGDAAGRARALAQLGNALSCAGEHDAARALHEESLALRERAGDARGVGLCLSDLGLAAARAGDHARAGVALERARALFERTDDRPALAAVYAHRGYVAADAGRREEALVELERARRIYVGELHHALFSGWLLLGLAAVERSAERARSALPYFERAGETYGHGWAERLANGQLTPC